jgi:hypothetical protein
MNKVWQLAAMAGLAAATCSPALGQGGAGAWKPVGGHIMTRWAKEVSPTSVLPEYPRPTMERATWQSLNGLWAYAITPGGAEKPPATMDGQILVPFPVESALSGVAKGLKPDQQLWYQRSVEVPAGWRTGGQRVLLHFGASDWRTTVLVNGTRVGDHTGGYDPFTFDITPALRDGKNEITVGVVDPTDTGGQPRGKQWLTPGGIWYTPTSGIWQTVWLEPVPAAAIEGLTIRGSAKDSTIRVAVTPGGAGDGTGVEVTVRAGDREVAKIRSEGGREVTIKIPDGRAWSPADPFLYDLSVRLLKGGAAVDEVRSYVGLRDISVGPDEAGVTRLLLNGRAVFQYGPLDQGFWPDGLYTPPTDAAMKFDIEAVQKMGGNMLRKHVKVEPERFYTWCDRMGVLVWQDMPSPFFRRAEEKNIQPELSPAWKENFEHELQEMLKDRGNHPSIVMWVPFNEGWGQNDLGWAKSVVEKVKAWDPSRVVNNASGWTDMKVGDTYDLHIYPGPGPVPPEQHRAGVLGEFGGLGHPVEGHTWVAKDNWGYVSFKTKQELTEAYCGLLMQMPMLIGQGLSAAVYTQTTDVEVEVNGWLTYDREVWKIDPDRAKAAALGLYAPTPVVRTIVPGATTRDDISWRYTTKAPAQGWESVGFNDSAWEKGVSGFGRQGTPGAVIRTAWESDEIWMRRTFDLAKTPTAPHLMIHHDEDADVYINGEKALTLKGYTTGYQYIALPDAAKKLLKAGENTLAIHCRQTGGGQYIDAGLVDLTPAGK